MNFSDKLKDLRKSKNMSQEQLAEKLYVSRQAITKWENGIGLPDIENLIAISALFNESLDNLLSEEKSLLTKHEFFYESHTEYDLDEEKTIDITYGTAHEVIIERTKSEKIEILLASNKLNCISQQAKVKIEEHPRRMDVKITHAANLSDISAKQDLFVFIKIPQCFVAQLELNGITENLRIRDIDLDNLEVSGKFINGYVCNSSGHIELDINQDLNVEVDNFKGKIDFNQLKSTSVLNIKNGKYYLRRIGFKNRFIDKDGKIIELSKSKHNENFSTEEYQKYDFIVETAGFNSEIKIC